MSEIEVSISILSWWQKIVANKQRKWQCESSKLSKNCHNHYSDVIMGAIASQIASLMIVYSTVHSDADQRKHQSSASLAFVRGIDREPVNSPHKWPVTRKIFPFDDVIMISAWLHMHILSLSHGFRWFDCFSLRTRVATTVKSNVPNLAMMSHKVCALNFNNTYSNIGKNLSLVWETD